MFMLSPVQEYSNLIDKYSKLSTRKRERPSASTMKRITIYWNKFLSSGNSIDYIGFIEWLSNMELSQNSKKTIAASVGKMMYMFDVISSDEFARIKSAFQSRYGSWSEKVMSDSDLIKFFDELSAHGKTDFSRDRNLLLFLTMSMTGARVGQVIDLQLDDIELTPTHTRIDFKTSKKNELSVKYEDKITHLIPINSTLFGKNLRILLQNYLTLHRKYLQNCWLFPAISGEQMTTANVLMICRNIAPDTGITPHSFRHTAVHRVVSQHGIAKGAMFAGHTNINTTKRYIGRTVDMMDEVYPNE